MEFATGALGTLLPKLGELLLDEYNLHKDLRKGIKDLRDELLVIQAVLLKVSDVPLDQLDQLVKIWANDVRELSYAIEDSLDSFMVRVEGVEPTKPHTFFGFIKKTYKKVTKLKIRREIANDIKDVKIQVREVKERYDRYKDVIGNTNARTEVDPRVLTMYTKVSNLVGIEKSMDELTEMLSKGDDLFGQKLKVVSVVGFGGLGKTTLAKAVHDKLKKNFDCGGFVPVGQSPDTKKVLRDILLELDRELYKASATMDEWQLINQLQKFLVRKRSAAAEGCCRAKLGADSGGGGPPPLLACGVVQDLYASVGAAKIGSQRETTVDGDRILGGGRMFCARPWEAVGSSRPAW